MGKKTAGWRDFSLLFFTQTKRQGKRI